MDLNGGCSNKNRENTIKTEKYDLSCGEVFCKEGFI